MERAFVSSIVERFGLAKSDVEGSLALATSTLPKGYGPKARENKRVLDGCPMNMRFVNPRQYAAWSLLARYRY
jgi:hypothetical protein